MASEYEATIRFVGNMGESLGRVAEGLAHDLKHHNHQTMAEREAITTALGILIAGSALATAISAAFDDMESTNGQG